MNTVGFLYFLGYLLIAGALLRWIEHLSPDSWYGKGLTVIY